MVQPTSSEGHLDGTKEVLVLYWIPRMATMYRRPDSNRALGQIMNVLGYSKSSVQMQLQ